MLFNTITALLSLTALVSAAPRPESGLAARNAALHFHPRQAHAVEAREDDIRGRDQNSNRFNKNDVIIDTTVVILSETQKQQEVDFILVVQEQVKRRGGRNFEKRKQKDQIRRNHYRNRNKNVNTVIVVVTEIIDVRDNNNRRSRYMTRQVRADNGRAQDVTVIVKEVVAITISNNNNNNNGRNSGNGRGKGPNGPIGSPAEATRTRNLLDLQAKASASAAALSAIQTVDPAAPFLPSNRTVMLPPGAAFPGFASVEPDPARIVEEGAAGVFVGSV